MPKKYLIKYGIRLFRTQGMGEGLCGLVNCAIFTYWQINYVKKLIRLSLILMMAFLISACASHHHKKHKKLKPGKPIPCPLKDC